MPGVFQLLDTLRNKLDCTLWRLRQQLRPSLRTSEIRLRRTVRTDFLLRMPRRATPTYPLPGVCHYNGTRVWKLRRILGYRCQELRALEPM